MTVVVPPANCIAEAWLWTLKAVQDASGTAVHVVTTVARPSDDGPDIASVLDEFLAGGKSKTWPVDTVASTIFPGALYRHQPEPWAENLPAHSKAELDAAATELFDDYIDMLPIIASDSSNTWDSTYFGRMVSWPGSNPPVNQLKERIQYLRTQHSQGNRRANAANIAMGGEGELGASLQIHGSRDRRWQGGPCLVHLDLTVHDGRLNMLATYRHWHLVTRALGNLLGLSRLLLFLCEQTGHSVGELTVVSGAANAQRNDWGGRSGVNGLIALGSATLTQQDGR